MGIIGIFASYYLLDPNLNKQMNESELKWNYTKSRNYTAPQLREKAVDLILNDNKTSQQVHELLGISIPSINEYVRRVQANGHVYTDEEMKKKKLGKKYKRPRKRDKITPFCGAIIKTLFDVNNQLTLDNCKTILNDSFGYDISIAAIHNYLVDEGISLKVITTVAKESDPESRSIFWNDFYQHCTDYKQLFFLDETWRNDKTINRRYGRSAVGSRCNAEVNMSRGYYKLNLLLACNWEGPICFDIYDQAVNPESFEEFLIETLAPHVNSWPGTNSILILDNHYTHETNALIDWAEALGVIIIYEPAHDPNTNLTEWVFNALKMKEKAKGMSGSSMIAEDSLIDSIIDLHGCNFKSVLDKIGYIDGVTDSDLR